MPLPGCDGKLDLTFVVDSSGSIRIERYPDVKEFVINITKQLDVSPERTHVAMMYWSDNAEVNFNLNDYHSKQDVIQAIRGTPFIGGRTHTADALRKLREIIFTPGNGDRPDAKNLAVFVSDGNSNINEDQTIQEAIEDRVYGIHMMAVAVGKKFTNMLEIEGIASLPVDANVFNVESYSGLQDIVQIIADATCDGIRRILFKI